MEEEDYVEYPDEPRASTAEITVTDPATSTEIADSSPLKFSSPDQETIINYPSHAFQSSYWLPLVKKLPKWKSLKQSRSLNLISF